MEINKEHFEKAMALQKAFDQGVQSQQQKIDEYAMVAESLDESYVRECKKNKELQKRIDDALKVLNDASPTMLDKKAIKILKGEQK